LEGDVSSPEELAAWQSGRLKPNAVTKEDWAVLDEWETTQGSSNGRPRRKLISIDEVLEALGRGAAAVKV